MSTSKKRKQAGPIKVLHLIPGQPHQVIEVDPDAPHVAAGLIGGGYLEMLTLTDDGIAFMFDEDGRRKQMTPNFIVNGIRIVGPAFFFRRADPEMASLTDDDVARIMEWVERL